MTSAAADLKPLKKSSSFSWLPPRMSELRVVLLGNSWFQRSSVGNLILGQTVFSAKEEPTLCLSITSWLKEKKIIVINTPNLLQPNISQQELTEHVEDCVSLSAPGPHVFLLLIQPEDFTEEHKEKLCRVLQRFSDQSFDHSLVLISTLREESPEHPPLKDMIRKCRYRNLKLKNLERSELLTRLGQTAKENNGDHVSRDESEDEDAGLSMTSKFESERIKAALNLVLCGRRGAEKTSAAKAILGPKQRLSVSNSSECVKHQGEMCGRRVSLVELPALYGKPQEEVMEESLRCISLCDPEGVHAFILVLPVGSITDEDKGELEIIQNTFSSRVDDLTMILFTVDSDPTAPAVDDFVKGNKEIQELRQSCGGRYFVLNIKDKQQIPELLEDVEKMRAEGSRCFTKDMFTKAQIEKVWKLEAELQDVKQRTDDGSQSLIQEPVETILKEKEEEMKRKEEQLKIKHEEDLKELNRKLSEQIEQERKLKEKQLMEKDECINKEQQERKREREEEERRWKNLLETSEKIVHSEKKHWENSEKKLELWREEMKRDRDTWDKERKDLWEQIRQEDKQRLEEEKTSHRKLQEKLQRKSLMDILMYSVFGLLFVLFLLFLYYVFWNYVFTTVSTNTRENT